jgi:hypothetical protein
MKVNGLLADRTLCEKRTKPPISQKLYELNTPHDQDTHGQLRGVEVKQFKLASSRNANVANEVQNIINDLERQPKQIAEPIKSIKILALTVSDQRTCPHRMNVATLVVF